MNANHDQHDAASNVARIAGLGAGDPPKAKVPPSALIARFCTDVPEGLVSSAHGPRRDDKTDAMVSHGFCGYSGGSGDLMVTGFDDGYTFMGHLGERGWRDLADKGDWPYVVFMRWPASDGEPETIIEYCEADLSVWQFDTHDAAVAFYRSIRDQP